MLLDINKNSVGKYKVRTEEKQNQGKCVQCHECEGFCDVRAECPTFLKKQKKGMSVSWSDYSEEKQDD